jgi:hypothetical protein
MGQQQLLLLVLATVVVGLATVAGIEAFDQGKSQAANDALTQKALSIAADIQAQAQKPEQFGGIDLSSPGSASDVANSIGYENASGIEASGAGEGATCTVKSTTTETRSGVSVACAGGNANTKVTANVLVDGGSGDSDDGDTRPDVVTTYGTGTV